MPVTIYLGIPRSGKSHTVVKEVICPAIAAGRNVVTNIDGINQEKIYEFIQARDKKADPATFGKIIFATAKDFQKPGFFPRDGHEGETVVKGGDLTCWDEAQLVWGYGDKLSAEALEFLTYHGHFVDPASMRCCDLVLMTQDVRLVNRKALGVVSDIFRLDRKTELGMDSTYVIDHFKGSSTAKGNYIQTLGPFTYDKDVFELYHSFKGGGQGLVQSVDKSTNLLKSKKVLLFGVFAVICLGYSIYGFTSLFGKKKPEKVIDSASATVTHAAAAVGLPVSDKPKESEWRVVGHFRRNDLLFVLLRRGDAYRTLVNPSGWSYDVLRANGKLDNEIAASWTGAGEGNSGLMGGAMKK